MPLALPKVRADLEYFDQVIEGEEVIIVRDPIRNTYLKYNELQIAMLKSLDGVRSLDEMVASLSDQYEVEIPRIAAERFVAHARKQMLLDIASYGVPEEKAAERVLEALRKQGFHFRDLAAGADDSTLASRVVSAEAVLFMGGIRHLRTGHPAKALDFFYAVLELNPDNKRARTLVDTIQAAYIKALGGASSDWPTYVVLNPTRLLQWVDRKIGRLIFHPLALLPLLALMAVAFYCYQLTPLPTASFGFLDAVLIVGFWTLHGFVHEFAHGLACVHYGGQVPEIGITFFYYVQPAPYCDTSSSYLFKDRKQQMIVQLAGSIMTLVFSCVLAIFLALVHPDLWIFQSAYISLFVTAFCIFINANPFLKFDGYYALCDFLQVPNLRERSVRVYKAWWADKLLGIPPEDEALTAKKKRMFIVFAAAATLFTTWWMYQMVFRLLAPVVEHFRGAGLVVALIVLGYLLRGTMVLPLVRLAKLFVAQRARIFTLRRTAVLLVLAALLVIPWTIRTPVRVDADLELAPRQRVEVRAQFGGIVEKVIAHEGDVVKRGQPLVQLRNHDLDLELAVAQAEVEKADAHLAELSAGTRKEQLAVAQSETSLAHASLLRETRRATIAARMASVGVGRSSTATMLAGNAAVSTSMAAAKQWNLATLEAGSRSEDIAGAVAERQALVVRLEHATANHELLTIRSPIDGVVVTKHLDDLLYTMLVPGDTYAEVHDASAYVGEIRLAANAPLDQIAVGDQISLEIEGAPGHAITTTIARVADSAEARKTTTQVKLENGELLVTTAPFDAPLAVAGLHGHARIFGSERSLAFSKLYLPLQRVFRVDLWSLF